jgi:hypothetical protein
MKKSLSTAVLLAAVLSLTACGSSGNSNAGLPSGTATNPTDRAVAFAQCMRQHGVQVSDPNQSGGVSVPGNVDQGTLNAAEQACAKYDIKKGGSGESAAEQDRNLKLAKCLRQHGLNVPDPRPGQGLMIGGPGTGSGSGAGSGGSGSQSQRVPDNGNDQQIMQECEQQVGKSGK